MDRSRRRLLAGTGGLVTALAGCLSSDTDGPSATSESPPDDSDSTTTTDYGDTVEVTTTVDREGLEHVASNDTVRYVAGWHTNRSGETPTRRPVYETIPFEEWVRAECARVAAERVSEAMDRRLGGNDDGITVGVTAESGERSVFVAHRTMLDRDGGVVSEPAVSYERVERVAPERAAVTLSFAGRTRQRTVGVAARETTVRQQ